MFLPRRRFTTFIFVSVALLGLWYFQLLPNVGETYFKEPGLETQPQSDPPDATKTPQTPTEAHSRPEEPLESKTIQHDAETVTSENYPVKSIMSIPSGLAKIPELQFKFQTESSDAKSVRLERLAAVKSRFKLAWESYKRYAWLKDELTPVEPGYQNTFGGWAATLVDSLDTLWIMGMTEEFEEALSNLNKIDFASSEQDELNLFETTIRYLGGFLGAYDISNGKYSILLEKAKELGDMLYGAFDTPNRMPVTRWHFKAKGRGEKQEAGDTTLIAEIGSLSLEFTRLSQLTADSKYFDAIQRITDVLERAQNSTLIPGLWPTTVNANKLGFGDNGFTLGGMADSAYEYLPKQHMLLGGSTKQYKDLYSKSLFASKQHLFFRPMTPPNLDIRLSGSVSVDRTSRNVTLDPKAQHLACFTGGMVGIGAKLFDSHDDMLLARKLVDGCIWAYNSTATGIMPEIFQAIPCEKSEQCEWDEKKWHEAVMIRDSGAEPEITDVKERAQLLIKQNRLSPGITDIPDRRYILRPEAIESVFILYRLTGDPQLPEDAWRMWRSIEKHTSTDIANAAISDVTLGAPPKDNRMESFWLAETLKYFYLTFSEPEVMNLDDFVL